MLAAVCLILTVLMKLCTCERVYFAIDIDMYTGYIPYLPAILYYPVSRSPDKPVAGLMAVCVSTHGDDDEEDDNDGLCTRK